MEEIDEQNWCYAHRLFQCVAAASRPLRAEELAEFLAFDFEAGSTPKFLADWRSEDPENEVLSICSTLLVVKPDSGSPVIQFAHFSVKEYLTSTRLSETKDTISRFHVSMTSAHTIVAQACLGFLLHLDENITKDDLEDFPLAEYAAEHWVDHARFESVSSNVHDGMKCLFDPRQCHLSVWVWIYDPEDPNRRFERSQCPSQARETSLHYAAVCGIHDIATFLIVEHSQDVNSRGFSDDETPLHVTVRRGHVELTQILLEHGADREARDKDDWSPLERATSIEHVELIRVLVEHGANVNARDPRGCTSLYLASGRGNPAVIRTLLKHGADVKAQNSEYQTPLHGATVKEVAQILLEHGADANAQGKDNRTPLHQTDVPEVAQILLEHGADANTQDKDSRTPLHQTSVLEVAQILLEHGADANAQDKDNRTPLHQTDVLEVAQILLEHGADPNALETKNRTPLHLASEDGQVGVVRVLLEHGVDVNARDAHNATPIHLAASTPGYREVDCLDVAWLLPQYGSDIHALDNEGRTAFMRATEEENRRIMELLLEQCRLDWYIELVL